MTGQHSSNVKEHFEEIYEKTKRSVTLFLISRCKSFDDVNDVLQEVYMEYFRILQKKGIAYVRDEEPFLISLCKKKLSSYYSFWDRIANRTSIDISAESELNEQSIYEEESSVEDDFYREEMLHDVKEILKRQPDCVQKIFYLYYSMELSVTEISGLLHMKPQTVKNRLFRTRKNKGFIEMMHKLDMISKGVSGMEVRL